MKHRHISDPSFLFSTWPLVEWRDGRAYVTVNPTGENDQPQLQAAVNRIAAVGGGVLRLSAGDYETGSPIYVDRYQIDS